MSTELAEPVKAQPAAEEEILTVTERKPAPESVKKDMTRTAVIFGQSDQELETEFKAYKARKLFRKINYDILDNEFDTATLKQKCDEAVKSGVGSITVLPNFIKDCQRFLRGQNIKVCSVVGYPYGEEFFKTKLFQTKRAVAYGADEIYACVSISEIKNGNYTMIGREVKRLVNACRDRPLCVVIETCALTSVQLERACREVSKYKIKYIATATGIKPCDKVYQTVKNIRSALTDKVGIIAVGDINGIDDLIRIFEIVDRVSIKNAPDIAEKLKTEINF